MTCDESQNFINARLDGELMAEDRAALDAHLAGCAACRATMELAAIQHNELLRAFAPRRRAARDVAERAISQLPRKLNRRMAWLPMLLSAAAGFAIAFGFFRTQPQGGIAIHPVSQPTSQPVPVAQLALATGAVQFLCPGDKDWCAMATGGSVPAGAQVRTGPDVRCEFRAADGSEIRLNADTHIRLGKSSGFELIAGEVWSNVGDAHGFEATSGAVSCQPVRSAGLAGQFDLMAKPQLVTLTVLQGPVRMAIAGGEQNILDAGEQATVTEGRLGGKQAVQDLALATRWVNEILVLKGRDNPELAKRIDDLFAQIGQQKMGFLFEDEIRALGDHSVIPLTKYLESDRSKNDQAGRAIAARIVSDVAPPWAIPNLIGLLQSDDGEVRFYAAAGLKRLTTQDFGRQPDRWRKDELFACRPTTLQWRTWWTRNHERYPGTPLELPEPRESPVVKERMPLKKG